MSEGMALSAGDGSRVLWVHQVTRYIKESLDSDPLLSSIWVRGEISNFKHHHSGHMYFTLKDEQSSIRCVMFRGRNARLSFQPVNGGRVVAAGAVSVYERDGQYQLYVERMTEDGLGALHQAFVELQSRLKSEGLFDPSRKRALPVLPRRIGVVTSLTGAAVRDIVSVALRRNPRCNLLLAPVLVQGPDAPPQIVRAVENLNRLDGVDVVIVGRGGGSLEELWAFNDERVARAIFASRVPVVSAVGHETDVTICDFVADVRAPTPSAAAELVVPMYSELRERIQTINRRAVFSLSSRLTKARQRLDRALMSRPLSRPLDQIDQKRQLVDELMREIGQAVVGGLSDSRSRLRVVAGQLEALSPRAVLGRGYSVLRTADGRVVSSVRGVSVGDRMEVVVRDGRIACEVEATCSRGSDGGGDAGD